MDPTGEIFVHPIKNMIAKFNEMLPKIDNLIGYMNSRTSDMTVMMEDLKITLRQAQTTFETINQMTAGTSGIPVNQNNASSQRLKYKSK
jgi:hypothetical protein